MPTPEEEAKKREGQKPARGGHTNPKKRKENAEALASLPTTEVPHPIPASERMCPHCGDEVKPIGNGDRSVEYEWIPGRLTRRIHIVETGRCPCKLHYARGPAPRRVKEGCTYGPAFLAKLAVDKCGDATPIYRVEKADVEKYGRWAYDNPKHVIVNLALGGGYPHGVNKIDQPYVGIPQATVDTIKSGKADTLIDWIRVTQQ